MTYNFPLLDVVEEDEVTEHGDEAEQAQAGHYVDHSVLQIKLSWTVQFRWLIEGLAGCLAGIISISVCWRQQTWVISWTDLPCPAQWSQTWSQKLCTGSACPPLQVWGVIYMRQKYSSLQTMEMCVPKIPTKWVQYSEVVPEQT